VQSALGNRFCNSRMGLALPCMRVLALGAVTPRLVEAPAWAGLLELQRSAWRAAPREPRSNKTSRHSPQHLRRCGYVFEVNGNQKIPWSAPTTSIIREGPPPCPRGQMLSAPAALLRADGCGSLRPSQSAEARFALVSWFLAGAHPHPYTSV
jgi:hypothetical protein